MPKKRKRNEDFIFACWSGFTPLINFKMNY